MKGQRGAKHSTMVDHSRAAMDQRHFLDLMLGAVSHDLRGPLSTVSMRAQVLLRQLPQGADWAELRKHASMIDAAVKGMAQILDSLPDIGSIEAEQPQLEVGRHDLGELIAEVCADQPKAEDKCVRLTTELPSHPLLVRCDQKRVRQALGYLIKRATKVTPSGRAVVVHVHRDDGMARVVVIDHGPPLADEQVEQLSQRYFEPTARHGLETLGLFVARGIVEAHGGRLRVQRHSEGSSLCFTLPFAHSERVPTKRVVNESSSSARSARSAGSAGSAGSVGVMPQHAHQVLIVDDCRDSVELLQNFLSARGYPVRVAYDGAEALNQIEVEPAPEIIVMDLSLPQVDGFKVAQMARARLGDNVRIVALTGLHSSRDKQRALQAGCNTVLVKPCPLREVHESMEGEMPNPS